MNELRVQFGDSLYHVDMSITDFEVALREAGPDDLIRLPTMFCGRKGFVAMVRPNEIKSYFIIERPEDYWENFLTKPLGWKRFLPHFLRP